MNKLKILIKSIIEILNPDILKKKSGYEYFNQNSNKIGIALCGLGNYSKLLAKGLEISNHCNLVGIVTGDKQKAKKWKKNYSISAENCYDYENFDEIVHNKQIDLIYIVLPCSLHKDFVIRSAKAGKHIIVEKPMGLSSSECKEMIAICKENKVQLAVGYRLHFEPFHLELKRLGQDKVYGQVRYIEASLGYKTYNEAELLSVDLPINYKWRIRKEF